MNRKEFGKLLHALREECEDPETGKKLYQEDLDKLCGFAKGFTGRLERGEIRVFDEEMLLKLANALELTRMERKEFLFAANGVTNSNTYPTNRDIDEELQHMADVLKNVNLPCFACDVYGDIIATNSLMTDILNVTDELRAYGRQNPVAYNVLFFIMWPKTGFLKMMRTNQNWRQIITSNVQWYRRISLRYRTSPHYAQLMEVLRKNPEREFRENFRRFWELAQIEDDLAGNMERHYKYIHPKYGHLSYLTMMSEETFSHGEAFYITYVPADLETSKEFYDLARKHASGPEGITVEFFAQWPKPIE